MALRLITAAVVPPVTLPEAKAHCRIDGTAEDALVQTYLDAAIAELDGAGGWLNRALGTQTWELALDAFPAAGDAAGGAIRLPLPPLQSVSFVKYLDAALDEQTLDAALYQVDLVSQPGWIAPGTAGWPATGDTLNAVTVRFVCGFGDDGASPPASLVPAPIRAAILLRVADLYQNRESGGPGEDRALQRLLTPWRIWSF